MGKGMHKCGYRYSQRYPGVTLSKDGNSQKVNRSLVVVKLLLEYGCFSHLAKLQ